MKKISKTIPTPAKKIYRPHINVLKQFTKKSEGIISKKQKPEAEILSTIERKRPTNVAPIIVKNTKVEGTIIPKKSIEKEEKKLGDLRTRPKLPHFVSPIIPNTQQKFHQTRGV